MSKQLALDQGLRDGAAVQRDKRPAPPGAEVMDGPRYKFLAGPPVAPCNKTVKSVAATCFTA